MPSKPPRPLQILAGIVAVGILAALFLPPVCGGGIGPARRASCAHNLRQLYALGTTYASTHKGAWPDARGGALWLSFAKTTPPLLQGEELEVLLCPVKGDVEPGKCDYLGPGKPVSELKPGEALAACKPGNHGEDRSGNVVLRDGTVREYDSSDPIWKTLQD